MNENDAHPLCDVLLAIAHGLSEHDVFCTVDMQGIMLSADYIGMKFSIFMDDAAKLTLNFDIRNHKFNLEDPNMLVNVLELIKSYYDRFLLLRELRYQLANFFKIYEHSPHCFRIEETVIYYVRITENKSLAFYNHHSSTDPFGEIPYEELSSPSLVRQINTILNPSANKKHPMGAILDGITRIVHWNK